MRIDVLVLDSNAFHLLTANVVAGSVEPDGSVEVPIGEGALMDGRITEKAYRRAMDAIETLLDRCEAPPVSVATTVFHEAANAPMFLDEVNRRFGLHIGRLAGEEEARLTQSRGASLNGSPQT